MNIIAVLVYPFIFTLNVHLEKDYVQRETCRVLLLFIPESLQVESVLRFLDVASLSFYLFIYWHIYLLCRKFLRTQSFILRVRFCPFSPSVD